MQFSQIATLLLTVAAGANAAPSPDAMMEPFRIHARSCGAGLLRGNALKLCQEACKAACNLIPVPAANGLCVKSCDQAPVNKVREVPQIAAREETFSPDIEAELETRGLEARACGLFTGKALGLCQKACSAACNAIPVEAAKDLCVSSCNTGALKVREEAEAEEAEDSEAVAETVGKAVSETVAELSASSELQTREPAPSTGGKICRAACAVTCNSTVLALAQKKCLEVCNGKCPN